MLWPVSFGENWYSKMYAGHSLREGGFDTLEQLARAYAKSRTKLPSPLDIHFLEEDIYDARTNLDAILNSVVE